MFPTESMAPVHLNQLGVHPQTMPKASKHPREAVPLLPLQECLPLPPGNLPCPAPQGPASARWESTLSGLDKSGSTRCGSPPQPGLDRFTSTWGDVSH